MKTKITVLFLSFLYTTCCNAQVVCDATLLTDLNNFCSKDAEYTNDGTIASGFGVTSCWNAAVKQEVWFKFNAIGTDIAVTVTGGGTKGTIVKPSIGLFTGDCTGATPITELKCISGNTNTTELYSGGMTPGNVYYIRIGTTTANAGTFTLCMDNSTPTASPGADCSGAVKLCNKNPVVVPLLEGGGKNPNEPENGSCLEGTFENGEHNSCWYYWVCDQSGTLTLELTPKVANTDIDFNFYSLTSGTDVCKNRKLIRCSASARVLGPTGLNMTETDLQEPSGTAASGNSFVKYVDMVSGTTYALLIDNADDKSGFTLSFGGTGTFVGPKAEITAPNLTICAGNTITFNGSNSTNYTDLNWNFVSGGNPTVATGTGPHTIKYDKPGDYVGILKAVDNIGCNSVASVNIKVLNAIPLAVTSDSICSGEKATLTASPDIPGATYIWSPSPISGDGTATVTVNPLSQQTYTVTCSKDGCVSSGEGTVYIKSDVKIVMNTPPPICLGGSATLEAAVTGGTGTYTYNWAPGNIGTTATVTVNPTTTQQYTLTVSDGGTCPTAPAVVTVVVGGPLAITATGADTICSGEEATLTAVASGGSKNYTYVWAPSGQTGSTITVKPTATTTYTVTLTDDCGTPAVTATVTVSIITPPKVKFSVTNGKGCATPLCVDFTDSSSTLEGKINQWKWDFGKSDKGIPEGVSDLKNPNHCYNNSGTYTITLTVTNTFGCFASDSISNVVNVYPMPKADFSAPTSISILSPDVAFSNTSIGGDTWSWNFGDSLSGAKNFSGLKHPSHTYPSEGVYCVSLVAKTIHDCVDKVFKCFVIEPASTLFIPNSFTPNGDGTNDFFFAKGENIFNFEMRIFDRWGNLIFYSDDMNKYWDGRVKESGLIAQQDVYVWDVTARDIKKVQRRYIGTVTLIK